MSPTPGKGPAEHALLLAWLHRFFGGGRGTTRRSGRLLTGVGSMCKVPASADLSISLRALNKCS